VKSSSSWNGSLRRPNGENQKTGANEREFIYTIGPSGRCWFKTESIPWPKATCPTSLVVLVNVTLTDVPAMPYPSRTGSSPELNRLRESETDQEPRESVERIRVPTKAGASNASPMARPRLSKSPGPRRQSPKVSVPKPAAQCRHVIVIDAQSDRNGAKCRFLRNDVSGHALDLMRKQGGGTSPDGCDFQGLPTCPLYGRP
jgi:hypothetical protein